MQPFRRYRDKAETEAANRNLPRMSGNGKMLCSTGESEGEMIIGRETKLKSSGKQVMIFSIARNFGGYFGPERFYDIEIKMYGIGPDDLVRYRWQVCCKRTRRSNFHAVYRWSKTIRTAPARDFEGLCEEKTPCTSR